jgi:clan AA aspartic protease (TIGR02281 family)
LGVLFALSPSGSARAEIYQWKDAQGRLHFAQDLNQVPPSYRSQAEAAARTKGKGREIQRYEPAPAAVAPRTTATRGKRGAGRGSSGEVHRIRVQRTGSSMRVNVRLNDSVVAPFILDTGASDVSIPEWVARELNLDLENARTQIYGTANGTIQKPVVTLDSVELGTARVENVPASVSKSMSVGLLGLSFFNHFRYRFDPVEGVVTLRPNGLVEAGKIRGGRSESQWRRQFAWMHARRSAVEAALDEAGKGSRRRTELEAALDEADRQLQVLESEADDARVPMPWRD